MQKTELGFYLITDKEYYNLAKPEPDVVYVLVNGHDAEYIVLKNGQFLGKIDKGLKQMSFTSKAMNLSNAVSSPMINNNFMAINNMATLSGLTATSSNTLSSVSNSLSGIQQPKKVEEKEKVAAKPVRNRKRRK